ncbi:sodium-coupled monocarboxylate transporter 2, partial [Elysia marginata]
MSSNVTSHSPAPPSPSAFPIGPACMEVGGLGEVARLSYTGGRTDFNRFTPDPTVRHTVWGLAIGKCFIWMVNEFNQSTLQRISSLKSLRAAQTTHLILMPLVCVYTFVFAFMGLVIYAYFTVKECDPYA